MIGYKEELVTRYWTYQQLKFPQIEYYFERLFASDGRPPVFLTCQAQHNVITKPDVTQEQMSRLLNLLPSSERHKWFRSMNSSQALTQSVLGNIAVYNHLNCLTELNDDGGEPLFGKAEVSSNTFIMEHKINHLGERRRTSLDGFVSGAYQVAIECKFTEAEMGTCSRPSLSPSASNFETDSCDGTFSRQHDRQERCSLTEIGVLYWRYVPQLFKWTNDFDLYPCPLNKNYQLVRNILAVGVTPDGRVAADHGHVILIYDDRNPAFQIGGDGLAAYTETRSALREPAMLRKCSWQRISQHIRDKELLSWLTEDLALKYGL